MCKEVILTRSEYEAKFPTLAIHSALLARKNWILSHEVDKEKGMTDGQRGVIKVLEAEMAKCEAHPDWRKRPKMWNACP